MNSMRSRHSALRDRQRPAGLKARAGLSLLEVILAIAILGGAMAVIGESIRMGTLAAADAREMTMAQLLCESKLAELSTGLQALSSVTGVPVEVAPDWLYSITTQQGSQNGLVLLAVTVSGNPQYHARPVEVTLYRWMIDPELAQQLEDAAAQAASASSSSSTSSSGSASGSTSSSGGGNG